MPDKSKPVSANHFSQLMASLRVPLERRKLAVAVSGGADSMALTLLLADWCKENGASLTALIFDHRIRPESTREAEQVKKWLTQRKIKTEILVPPTAIGKRNLQAQARQFRYTALTGWCREHKRPHLFTAHHAGDQLETMLMRLTRGSGLEGLSGIAPVSEREGITLLRPFLGVSKPELIATLTARKAAWVEDPSNYSAAYARNRIRKVTALLEEEGITASRIASASHHLQSALSYIQQETTRFLESHVQFFPAGYAVFPADGFANTHPEITFRALKRIIAFVNGSADPLRAESLLPLHENLRSDFQKSATVAGVQFYPHPKAKSIYCLREPKNTAEDIRIHSEKTTEWDNRFIVRPSKKKKKTIFLGALGTGGIAELPPEFLKQSEIKAIPRRVLATIPAIRGVEAVLGVPHIGYWVDTGLSETLRIEYAPLKRLAASHPGSITGNVSEVES